MLGRWPLLIAQAFLLVHLWLFSPNSSQRANIRKRQKGTPQHVWCVIIFLMTVSSEKWIRSEKERKKVKVAVDAAKDLFEDMFYVKALDTGRDEDGGRNLNRCWNPKRTTNNTQQVYTIINYILFYETKLGLWVRGSFQLCWKAKKGKRHEWMCKGLLTASFFLMLKVKPGNLPSLYFSPTHYL